MAILVALYRSDLLFSLGFLGIQWQRLVSNEGQFSLALVPSPDVGADDCIDRVAVHREDANLLANLVTGAQPVAPVEKQAAQCVPICVPIFHFKKCET